MQGLGLGEKQPQIGRLMMEPLGILEQALPVCDHIGNQGMIDGTRKGHILTERPALIGCHEPVGFDHRGKAELAVGIQQLDLADLAQIQPHRVLRELGSHLGTLQIDDILLKQVFILHEDIDVRVSHTLHDHVRHFVGIGCDRILNTLIEIIQFFPIRKPRIIVLLFRF